MSEPDSHFFQPPSLEELAELLPSYEMMDFLAQGGMGAVYLAKQISLDRLVAIKVLPPSWGSEKGYAQRFQTEAKAMAKLRHNHIVGVYDFGITSDGHLYLVMEYVEGQTIHDMIRLRRLPVPKVQGIALQLCDAIQYAHEHGILHRDLKPGNVMVDKHGQVKVMDFGLARRVDAAVEEESLGTPEYTAPEILVEGALIDHRADIYALGIVFQQMLTGHVPRQPREPLSEHGVFDPGWEPLIAKAAATNAGARFQSMRDLREALAQVGKPAPRAAPGRRIQGGPSHPSHHAAPPPPPKSGAPVLPIIVSLVVIGVGVYWWQQNKGELSVGENAAGSAQTTNTTPASGTAATPGTSSGDSSSPATGSGAAAQGAPYQLPNDIPAGHVYKFQEGHKDIVNDVLLFPDQHRVATASTDGTIAIWDLHTSKRLQTLGPVTGALLKMAVSHDGKYLAAGGDNYKVHLWNLDDRLSEPTKSLDLKVRTILNLEFSSDDSALMLGTADAQQPLIAWTWGKDTEDIVPGFRGQVIGLQMLPGSTDGFVAAGSRRDNERLVYDLWFGHVSRRSLVKEYPAPPQAAFRLRISPDGKTILSLSGGRFQVWDLESGTAISRQQGGHLGFYRCEFVDGGRLIAAGAQDRTLRIFETITGMEVWKSDPQDTRCANAFAVGADGKFLVSAGGFGNGNPMEKDGDYALHVWKLPDLSTLKSEGATSAMAKR
ncbi:MAG: protein kinase, partial [Roseimicrobium sp.]